VEDCRIGVPAVFAALKRTYGKKERMVCLYGQIINVKPSKTIDEKLINPL
jgi:hypothetical protein